MTIADFRRAIRSKELKKDLAETFAKHALQVLEDDGAWIFLDDYTDTAKIHIRELGWSDARKWRHMGEFYGPVVGES